MKETFITITRKRYRNLFYFSLMSLAIFSLCAVVPLLSYGYFLTTFLFIFFCVYGLLVGVTTYLFIRKNLRVSIPYLIGFILFLVVYLFAALSFKENEVILPLLEFVFLVSLLISFLIFKTDKETCFQEYVIPLQRKELVLGIISTLSFLLSFLLSLFNPLNGEYGEISYSFTVILLVISILLCTYLAFKNKTKIPVKITLFFLFLVFSALIMVSASTQNPVGSSSSSYFENFQIASLFSGPYGVLLLILLFALNLEEYPVDELEIKSSTICKRSVFYLFSISRSVLFCLFLSFCSYPAFFPDGPNFLDSFLSSIYASIALIFIGIALFFASLQNSHSWHLPFIFVFLFIDIFILSIPNWQFGESSSFNPAFSYIYMICSLLVFFLVDIGMQSLFHLSYNHTHDFIPSLSHRTSSYLNLLASLFFLSVSFEWPFLLQGQRLHPAIMGSCLTLGLLLLFLSAYFLWKEGEEKRKIILYLSLNVFLYIFSFLSYYFFVEGYFVFISLLYACSIILFEMRIIGKMQDYSYRKKRGEINS